MDEGFLCLWDATGKYFLITQIVGTALMLPIPQRLGIHKEPALGVFCSPTSDLTESLKSSWALSILR